MKRAPDGYYTAKQAIELLGLSRASFYDYVEDGKIKRYVPPLRTEGFYKKKEIDLMAAQIALILHIELSDEEDTLITTRVAKPEDAQGIREVLTEGFGWQSASVEQRLAWYRVNPLIDYVVVYDSKIAGYITAVPYVPTALEDMMAGRKRAWHIEPDDILPFLPGRTYTLYVGAAVRRDMPDPKILARRLLSKFINFLQELAESEIVIEKLYAVSNQEDGIKLCKKLGFVQQETQPGDLFPDSRFMLDLTTSDSHFAKLYRKTLK